MDSLRTTSLWFAIALSAISLPSHAKPFENTMAQRLQACTACHGDQGRAGPDGYYPRLAGKPAGYLYNQLVNFREGRRHYGLMTGLVDTLSDDYLREIAHYFSALELSYPKPVPSTASTAVLARGQQLATRGDAAKSLPACTQCHGTQLTGVLPQTPGLVGLPRDYLNAQLGGWKTGQRRAHAPDCMADIAKKLSDADANAVTHWLSSQVVPSPAHPANVPPQRKPEEAEVRCGKATEQTQTIVPSRKLDTLASKGAYLARIGNCAACHTARGGAAMAGGKRLDTDFGSFYTSNLTPHPSRGIGAWTPEDFWQAMHHGKSRNGRLLYPAFPYTNYTQLKREDTDALLTYLRTLPASDQANRAHEMSWPYSAPWALAMWRWLYFKPAPEVRSNTELSAAARGSYLVNGLGHCSACHAPRNRLGAITAEQLSGAEVPGSGWLAPAVGSRSRNKRWTQGDLVQYLQQGQSVHGNANGPMAEVVLGSTQYLTDGDARAMAAYLVPGTAVGPTVPAVLPTAPESKNSTGLGSRLYEKHCATCHGAEGQGVIGAYPPLAGNSTVNAATASNLVQITLQGGFAPATAGNPQPFGMPPFQLQLSNQELASLLTFIRGAWENAAAPVSEFDINKLHPSQTH